MNKQRYITPETEICVLRMNGRLLDGYTIIDLSNPKQVTGGEINSNGNGIWDEADNETQDENELWDQL